MAPISAFAPAKINLSLHVTGQRADGYHLLDSLVAFADVGDRLTFAPSKDLSLTVSGPQRAGVPTDETNLAYRAARAVSPDLGAHISLEKYLPSAAGIGGGSSDAAATLRGLSHLWSLPLASKDTQLSLGADVPVCMECSATRMTGIGQTLLPIPTLPPIPAVLVNPGVSVPTPDVFSALVSKANTPMPETPNAWGSLTKTIEWIATQRNDLQAAAISRAPVIQSVLSNLRDAVLARMSGSGATCFGLYLTQTAAQSAAARIRAQHPDWWVTAALLSSADCPLMRK